ncbi:MAG: ester cyclase [Ottowia sp.]|uniref:ester cyclase n=1 Tax=Ottowia sp. TaxID=1898956 RepID=UPI003C7130AF
MNSLETNKEAALVHARNATNTEQAMAAISPDVVWHGPTGSPRTLDAWKARHARLLQAFEIVDNRIEKAIAEGDLVFVEWSCAAIHRGPFLGIEPTGKRVSLYGMYVDRVVDGKVVEHWGLQDTMGLVSQLGGMPRPEAPRSAA